MLILEKEYRDKWGKWRRLRVVAMEVENGEFGNSVEISIFERVEDEGAEVVVMSLDELEEVVRLVKQNLSVKSANEEHKSCGYDELLDEIKNYKVGRIVDRYPKFLQKEAIKIIKEALEVKKEIYGKSSLDNVMYEIFGKGLVELRKELKLHKTIVDVIRQNPEKDFGHIVNEVFKVIDNGDENVEGN